MKDEVMVDRNRLKRLIIERDEAEVALHVQESLFVAARSLVRAVRRELDAVKYLLAMSGIEEDDYEVQVNL
jgi:hypothetical protein